MPADGDLPFSANPQRAHSHTIVDRSLGDQSADAVNDKLHCEGCQNYSKESRIHSGPVMPMVLEMRSARRKLM